jgi:hypothetical protein
VKKLSLKLEAKDTVFSFSDSKIAFRKGCFYSTEAGSSSFADCIYTFKLGDLGMESVYSLVQTLTVFNNDRCRFDTAYVFNEEKMIEQLIGIILASLNTPKVGFDIRHLSGDVRVTAGVTDITDKFLDREFFDKVHNALKACDVGYNKYRYWTDNLTIFRGNNFEN